MSDTDHIDDPEEQSARFRAIAEGHNAAGNYEIVERLAKERIREYGADVWPHKIPKDAPPDAVIARQYLLEVRCLRLMTKKGDVAGAVFHAFKAGRVAERMRT